MQQTNGLKELNTPGVEQPVLGQFQSHVYNHVHVMITLHNVNTLKMCQCSKIIIIHKLR